MVGPSSTTGGRRYYYARVGWRDRYSALQRGKRILTSGTVREREREREAAEKIHSKVVADLKVGDM